jgi:two-component system NtrC family sensor kinase
MEKGALRCRDIVQSLLGFTRKSTSDNLEIIDMREVLEQALKITELQTRSLGIATKLKLPEEMIYLKGQFNALAQAIRNILQNSQEAIVEKLRQQSSQQREQGRIEITLHNEKEGISIGVRDNGAGFDASIADQVFAPMYTTKDPALNPGLGLTVAQEILRDHGGSLEISSTPGTGTTAKISLPIAENEGVSSSF